ncbi:MAG TPA: 4'-phosphopantetheinyl transferase superfamily protein [Streptomyces sp.]|nr:4'-phosphopantetheinyl transferase superfamily protein [Streptomyces sp.]
MIEELLPPQVELAESFGDAAMDTMFQEEALAVAGSADGRRREFATVRDCARQALGRLGVPPAPILPGPHGAPQWPAAIVGSMTHCTGYRAAAVARSTDLASIGLDAECNKPLPNDGVLAQVVRPEERDQLAVLAARRPDVCWDRLFFSAKESVYKAWYPLTGRWLSFHEATLTMDPRGGTFTARLLVPGPFVAGTRVAGFQGGWLARDGLLVTAITVRRTAN